MTWYVTYDTASGTAVAAGATDPGAGAPGQAVRAYDTAPSPTASWDAAARDYVEVTPGLPVGALVYVLDPADPLGMPVDVQLGTDPAPAAPKTTAPVTTQPHATDEWLAASDAFGPSTALEDRITHGLLGDLVRDWQALRDARAEAATRSEPTAIQTQLQTLVDRAWRKVSLTVRGQVKAG